MGLGDFLISGFFPGPSPCARRQTTFPANAGLINGWMMTSAEFKCARLRLGLTQSQMGKALRLSGDPARSVRKWEQGEREISGPVSLAVEHLLEQQR
jgi:DNA-binding transcriptional regulator YiaG